MKKVPVGAACLTIGVALVALAPLGVVSASSASISRAYNASETIVPGSLVSLDSTKAKGIVLANRSNSPQLVGIAVGANDSIVSIGSQQSTVQVAITGVVSALATTVNGPIKIGDQVGVSPFSGIGSGVEPNTRVIGLAQSELNDAMPNLTTRQVKDKDGKEQSIKVGYVQVNISIGPPSKSADTADKGFLQRSAKAITGKDVSQIRIVIGSFVAIIAIIALVALIYSTVYATIIAIGRNPLAKQAVFRTLFSVMAMAFLTAGAAVGAIYLILH